MIFQFSVLFISKFNILACYRSKYFRQIKTEKRAPLRFFNNKCHDIVSRFEKTTDCNFFAKSAVVQEKITCSWQCWS